MLFAAIASIMLPKDFRGTLGATSIFGALLGMVVCGIPVSAAGQTNEAEACRVLDVVLSHLAKPFIIPPPHPGGKPIRSDIARVIDMGAPAAHTFFDIVQVQSKEHVPRELLERFRSSRAKSALEVCPSLPAKLRVLGLNIGAPPAEAGAINAGGRLRRILFTTVAAPVFSRDGQLALVGWDNRYWPKGGDSEAALLVHSSGRWVLRGRLHSPGVS